MSNIKQSNAIQMLWAKMDYGQIVAISFDMAEWLIYG